MLFPIYLFYFYYFYFLCLVLSLSFCFCCGSFCHQNKFLVFVSIPGNKALSDSDFDIYLLQLTTCWGIRQSRQSLSSTLNTTTEVRPLSKAPNPQLPRSKNVYPLLWVCVHGVCVHYSLGWVKCRAQMSHTSLNTLIVCTCIPELIPIRKANFSLGRCLILNLLMADRKWSAIVEISSAWLVPLLIGSPLATIYASPIVSTYQRNNIKK